MKQYCRHTRLRHTVKNRTSVLNSQSYYHLTPLHPLFRRVAFDRTKSRGPDSTASPPISSCRRRRLRCAISAGVHGRIVASLSRRFPNDIASDSGSKVPKYYGRRRTFQFPMANVGNGRFSRRGVVWLLKMHKPICARTSIDLYTRDSRVMQ